MKLQPTTAAIGLLFALVGVTTHAEPTESRISRATRPSGCQRQAVVEAPPLTAASQRYVKGGASTAASATGREVFMIESQQGLMECRGIYLSETGCVPSSLGHDASGRASGR